MDNDTLTGGTGEVVPETTTEKRARLKAERAAAKAELNKQAGEADVAIDKVGDAVGAAGDAIVNAAQETGQALVAYTHFVEAGFMSILDKVYEIKDGIVEILPEHSKYAEYHGLKPKE